MQDSTPQSIPVHDGVGLAAVILGAAAVPSAVIVGLASLSVELPVFGVWWFLPVVAAAIGLGIFAARTTHGVAGATLGVVALVVCLVFVVVDRSYGPGIRGQRGGSGTSVQERQMRELFESIHAMPATRGTP